MTKSPVALHFADVEAAMRVRFRGWEKDLPHQGEKGGIRERRVADLLSSVLPKKCGIGTGHIANERGEMSLQTDIVIYDAANCLSLPVDDYYSLFPCECVYAAVEVKSKLTARNSENEKGRGEIYRCLDHTTGLRSLSPDPRFRIFSAVFAYETSWSTAPDQRVLKWFYTLARRYSKDVPDMVLVLEPAPGFVIAPGGPSGYNEFDNARLIVDVHPLLYFVSHLARFVSEKTRTMPSLWHQYVDFDKHRPIARLIKFSVNGPGPCDSKMPEAGGDGDCS